MKEFRISAEEARFGISCEECGYPMDSGDRAIDLTNGYGPVACSKGCAEEMQRREDERLRKLGPHQVLSNFI